MLSSVFSRRKGIQRKLTNLTHIRRAHSPPSPGSFATPEISEKPFNPYALYHSSNSQQSVNQAAFTFSPPQAESSKRASSPRVQLDFSAEALSLSDWFPAELLQGRSESPARRPERNVSLGISATTSGPSAHQRKSAQGKTQDLAAESGNVAGDSMARISELVVEDDQGDNEDSGHDFAPDDVIVIEAPRGRDPNPSPLGPTMTPSPPQRRNSNSGSAGSPAPSRRPAPLPIKIPVNPSSSKARAENPEDDDSGSQPTRRCSTAKANDATKAEPSSSRPGSRYSQRRSRHQSLTRHKSSRRPSVRKSRHPSLARPRSRARSYSRPSSVNSRCSDTDGELDDGLSAISGTTIARALVSSYMLSPSPSAWNSSSAQSFSRGRGHLARQDSATLPKGEYPFVFNRKSIRSSKGSVASTGVSTGGNYWRDRKISGDQIVILSPEERERENWEVEVPPLPPMPGGLSPGPSARSSEFAPPLSNSRRTLPDVMDGAPAKSEDDSALQRHSSTSICNRRATKELTVDPDPERKRRRVSTVSAPGESGTVSSCAISASTSSGTQQSSFSTESNTEATSQTSLASEEGLARSDSEDVCVIAPMGSSASARERRDDDDEGQELIYTRSPPTRHASSPDAPTTATSASLSVYSDERNTRSVTSPAGSGSVYSGTHSPASTAILSPGLTSIVSYSSPGSSSVRTPGSSSLGSAGSREPIFRSFSEARLKRNDSPTIVPVTMLPIGERPRSAQVPHSPSSPNAPLEGTRPQSMLTSARVSSIDSPDLLDIMFAGSRPPLARSSSSGAAVRVGSPPAPISVPPRPTPSTSAFELVQDETHSPSGVHQRFPETPYAFTPLVSAGFASPALPRGSELPPPLPRTGTISARGAKPSRVMNALGRSALLRSASLASPPVSATHDRLKVPASPPLSASILYDDHDSAYGADDEAIGGRLGVIEENSAPSTPGDEQSSYTNVSPKGSPFPSQLPLSANASPTVKPSAPLSRPVSPMQAPAPALVPLPPSPLPSPSYLKRKHSSLLDVDSGSSAPSSPVPQHNFYADVPQAETSRISVEFPKPPVAEDNEVAAPPVSVPPRPLYISFSQNRATRTRPPPPTGPRKLSVAGSHSVNRNRAASVSSVGSLPSGGAATASQQTSTNTASPSPRFQTAPIRFRGLTMEAAQWTFTSDQLQQIVSAAIKQSSDAAAIRLLPIEAFLHDVPSEIQRLDALSSELKTKYKLGMRKRTKLLGTLLAIADGGELADHTASLRTLEELTELSDSLDHIAEDLYRATDQLKQLTHLEHTHSSSALAMALRKLNTSFIKHLAENQTLRQQVAALEDERDEAWQHAQDAAQELDALVDRCGISEGVITPASSRRSSRVIIARKTSVRKAELRSPSRLRSQRLSAATSIATSRSSQVMSPSTRMSASDHIPPVPAIPIRTPIGILSPGLPTRSSAMTSATPNSEIRAMMRAQEELYEMLGIRSDDSAGSPGGMQRSLSMSAVGSNTRDCLRARHNSEVPASAARKSDAFKYHYRSRSIDDRTAVLATIGMISS